MKKKFFQILGCSFMAAFLMTACNSEESLVKDEIQGEKGKLSFVLPMGVKKAVTYAAAMIPAEDAENEIKNLKIYWFKSDGHLFKVFSYPTTGTIEDPATLTETAADKTQYLATIPTGTENDMSHFYIVANVNGMDGIRSSQLAGVTLGVTTETAFTQLLASDLADDASGMMTLLGCPMPMSIASATNGSKIYIEANPSTTSAVSANLNRRVARFDILNNAEYSNFEIRNVVITKANRSGFLQDGQTGGTFTTGTVTVDVSATANGTPTDGVDLNGDDLLDNFADGTRDSLEWNKSQFYLYPTTLTTDATGTEIRLEGVFDGHETRIYALQLSSPLQIVANSAYKISVKRNVESRAKITLTIDPWEWNNDTIRADRDASPIVFQRIEMTDPTQGRIEIGGDPDNVSFVDTIFYNSATDTELKLKTLGNTLDGGAGSVSTITITTPYSGFLSSDLQLAIDANANIQSPTVKTYGLGYQTTHTIQLPPTDAPIAYEIVVTSATNSSRKKRFVVVSENYSKTGFKPVKVGNLYWAPVNVGATAAPNTAFAGNAAGNAVIGNVFQWGRNTPFTWWGVLNTTTTKFTSADDANASDAFYKVSGDWMDSQNDDLWGGGVTEDLAKMQGPCPDGWRVPRTADCQNLVLAVSQSGGSSGGYKLFTVTATNDLLYFPMAGCRATDATTAAVPCSFSDYWTSTPQGTNANYMQMLNTNANISTTAGMVRSYGFFVRAVRDYVPMPWEALP